MGQKMAPKPTHVNGIQNSPSGTPQRKNTSHFSASSHAGCKCGDNTATKHTQKTGEKAKVKFTKLTHTTLYHFITGHAFTGEYTQCFYPAHMPEQVASPCGKPVQTIEHVLMECPLYTATCQKHLTANGWPQSLPQLFAQEECVQSLLCFLEETGACAKPWARWELG